MFRETADEHPDAETGDAILVLSEQEHSVSKRNELSLVEAHCGVTTSLREILQPMMQRSDPFENDDVFLSRSASSSL